MKNNPLSRFFGHIKNSIAYFFIIIALIVLLAITGVIGIVLLVILFLFFFALAVTSLIIKGKKQKS